MPLRSVQEFFFMKAFIFIVFNVVILPLKAQESLNADDFYDDIPTVLTISRLEQPKSESPSSVTVISKEQIKAAGVRELADIFRLVPGFIVGHLRGNSPVVTYHGLGSEFNRQLQILVDGRSVYIPSFGGVPWSNLPVILEDIEKVEVTRGPNAASYGANSYLAVINIITQEAFQGSGVDYAINYSHDRRIKDGFISINQRHNDLNWKLSAKTQQDDGFEAFSTFQPENDNKDITKFNFKTSYSTNNDQHWSFQMGQSSGELGRGEASATNQAREENVLNRFQSLKYEYSLNNSTTSFQLFHTEDEVIDHYLIQYEALPSLFLPALIDYDRHSERTELEAQQTIQQSEDLRLVYGGSLRKDTVNSFFLLGKDSKQDINVKRLFAHAEYKFSDSQIINIGTMIEDSEVADTSNSPRLAYIQHLNPNNTLRLSYSKAYRNPVLFETNGRAAFALEVPAPYIGLIPNMAEFNMPNEQLKPETIDAYEVALNHFVEHGVEADLKLYHYKIQNQMISSEYAEDVNQYINNTSPIRVNGIEASLSLKPTPSLTINSGLNLILNVDSGDIEENEKSFPKKTGFIQAQYQLNKSHHISSTFYYRSKIEWIDFTGEETNNLESLNIRYAYTFNTQTPLTLELIGNNLLDKQVDYREDNIQTKVALIRLTGSL